MVINLLLIGKPLKSGFPILKPKVIINIIFKKRGSSMKSSLIAPCGMNCNLCIGYLREKNRCLGCRENDENILNSCRKCIIKNCTILQQKKLKYCSSKCEKFPCTRLKNLDKRYRTKYQMSMLGNLQFIEEFGIRKFVVHEKERWVKEDSIFCVHHKKYYKMEKP